MEATLKNRSNLITFLLFLSILFLTPLFPDVKLSRPKLLLFETGLYGIFYLWLVFSFLEAKFFIRRSFVFFPLLVYGAVSIAFYYLSPDRAVALSELKRGLLSITAFFVASHIIDSELKRKWALNFFVAGSFLAFIYGILQYSGGIWIFSVPKMGRVMSTFGNPIFFAAHIVIVLPIAISLIFAYKKPYSRGFFIIAVTAGLFALYLSRTRAAYIGFIFSMFILIFLNIKAIKSKSYIFVLFLAIAAAFGFFTKNIWSRHQAHTVIWRDSLVMWSKSPWIGTGPGTFHIYFPKFASEELKKIWPQNQFIVNDAHSEYVQYLTETGIIGFGIFLWLLSAFYKNSLILLKKQEGAQRYIMSGLIASGSGILVQNMFSVDMRFIISALNFFLVMGIIESFNDTYFEKRELSKNVCVFGVILTIVLGFFSFKKVLEPYIAEKAVANTPDFFDEKVLEPLKSVAQLEELAQKYPDKASIYEKLGWIYAKEKNWEPAISNYEKASRLNPNIFGPLNNLGNIYFLLNQREKAISYWKRSLEINPGQTDSLLNLATAYYYQGQLKEAADELKKVLAIDPKNQKAIVMLKQMVE
ncbi:MAG: tetratricopeptide repeat protein [Elusimicrobia bacterium]|nr:tetratricopeptide repeat protein [Candidatus Liberimonas magnetica]